MSGFPIRSGEITAPAADAFTITPDDSANLASFVRSIYVGNSGHINVTTVSNTTLLFQNVPAGFILPVRAGKVSNTGTTATNLVGLV
jgi:hypothetical protein